MKLAAAGVAVAATIAGVAVYGQQNGTQLYDVSSDAEKAYSDYLAKHGKSYATEEEYKFRLSIFAKNLEIVTEHNEENAAGARLGMNSLADWTEEEYRRLLGTKPAPKRYRKHHHKGHPKPRHKGHKNH